MYPCMYTVYTFFDVRIYYHLSLALYIYKYHMNITGPYWGSFSQSHLSVFIHIRQARIQSRKQLQHLQCVIT